MESQQILTYNYASGRIKYLCKHLKLSASTNDSEWFAYKLDDSDVLRLEGPRLANGGVASEAAIDGLNWSF